MPFHHYFLVLVMYYSVFVTSFFIFRLFTSLIKYGQVIFFFFFFFCVLKYFYFRKYNLSLGVLTSTAPGQSYVS